MARRLRNNLVGAARRFSSKLDAPAATHLLGPPDIVEEDVEQRGGSAGVRYSVCRDRTASKKFVFAKNTVADTEEKKAAGLGENDDINDGLSIEKCAEDQHHGDAREGYRNFSVSTTYKNVVLPLKSSKLAPPFPEPVKVMPSHTVSDQEKADQMLAEKRVPMSIKKANRNY